MEDSHCRTKGQIKLKADWLAVDSPKKRRNKFVFVFAVKSKKAKNKQICSFNFWENLRRANLLTVLPDL